MNIENYRTFLTLAMTESFSKTAEHMHIVQSTVSSRINELEKYLDIKLFNRTNRKVEITSAGKALIPYANKLLEIEEEGKAQIHSVGNFEDCLKISVPGSVYKERLSPVINDFYRRYPEYSIDIRFHKTSMQLEMLIDNDSDIGFISRIPNTKKLEIMPYLEYSWILISRTDYDIKDNIEANELTTLDIAYNHLNSEYNEWLQDVLPRNFRPRINLNSTAQLIEYVKKGYGCAFVPKYSVEKELKSAEFKEIEILGIRPNKFCIYVAVNKKRRYSKAVVSFLAQIPELDEFKYNIL